MIVDDEVLVKKNSVFQIQPESPLTAWAVGSQTSVRKPAVQQVLIWSDTLLAPHLCQGGATVHRMLLPRADLTSDARDS